MASLRYPRDLVSGPYWIQYSLYPHPSGAGGDTQHVCLPLPPEISDGLEASWETEESGLSKDKSLATDFGVGDKDGRTPWYKKAWRGLTNQVRERAVPERYRADIQKGKGQALNTHEEHYFKSMEFKTWEFTHKMYPRNSDESSDVQSIIKAFKSAGSPTLDPGNSRYFGYPDSVGIIFQGTTGLPTIARCIIEKVEVNYTPNDGFQALPDGASVGYEITLGFKEQTMPTRIK